MTDAVRLAKALKARRAGAGWMASCPAHDDATPSLSIRCGAGGQMLVHCHAGCRQQDVIAALKQRGLWRSRETTIDARRTDMPQRHVVASDAPARSKAALLIWRAALCAGGTLAEAYLRARSITLAAPSSLRFHPRLRHPSGDVWPAMVALVVHGATGEALAVHRTFLAPDGQGKACVNPPKMMLGPCRGGVVRLGEPGDLLLIGEGIETCLAAMQVSRIPAWAALSTSGLQSLDLPRTIRNVVVLADGDAPGEAAARSCALRWSQQGRSVRIARPPQGMDFNDLLKAGAPVTFGGLSCA